MSGQDILAARKEIDYAIEVLQAVRARELSDQRETVEGVIWHLERYIENRLAPVIYGSCGERGIGDEVEQPEDAMPEGYSDYKEEESRRTKVEEVEIRLGSDG